MSERDEIEQKIEELLQPLKDDGTLKYIKSIGALGYEDVLTAGLAKIPMAVIKYTGKNGELQNGGLMHYNAEISIMVATKSYKGIDAQRRGIFALLEAVEDRLVGKQLTDSYWPLVLTAEQWSMISGFDGTEAWEQRYNIQWEELPTI